MLLIFQVHDTPSVIGDLLAELTQFALDVSAFAADHSITLNIGITNSGHWFPSFK